MIEHREARVVALPLATVAKRMCVGMHSYGFHWRAARENARTAKFTDAFGFLKYAMQIGAGGVQVAIGDKDVAYAQRIGAFAEENGLSFEAQFLLPLDETTLGRFEREVRLAREAGATVFRTACLSSRRYETFKSAAEFLDFRERSTQSIRLAEPILKKHRLRVAIENHKDWLIPELLKIIQSFSSEWIGVCIDTGNSIALLEDPMEVVEAFAPFAASTHIKDMGLQDCADGFLLSEVPLGDGFLPLKRMMETVLTANPKVQFNLEMITRDPLRVPCLKQEYWATMGNTAASQLARTLGMVKQNVPSRPLPKTTGLNPDQQLAFEHANVTKSLQFANQKLV